MPKYNLEYKVVLVDENGTNTQHVKKVVEEGAVATIISTLATQQGIEFFTLRKVPETKVKTSTQKLVLKEAK